MYNDFVIMFNNGNMVYNYLMNLKMSSDYLAATASL